MANESVEAKAFAKYLENKKIVIADGSATARSGMFKILQQLGATNAQMILVSSFQQAASAIESERPHIVVAEYDLDKRCGLELLQNQRVQRPKETKETIFVVVTSNTSQTAVARAAEEDIDAYILKPFTVETVRKTLMRAALSKVQPSDYMQTIEEGKKLLAETKVDAAEACFQRAVALDPAPSLAHYYLGQAKYLRKIMEMAKGSYNKGLEFNKIHYKCLVGLYELLMDQKQHSDAYEIVKRISQYFPANPKRLTEVLRLAIMNGKYEDVEKYYSIFSNIDERDDVLIKYVCAALVVCGRYYLNSRFRTRAMELFQKAAATGSGRVKILKEIVQALIDHNLMKEAEEYLAKLPPESQNGPEYLTLKFQILNADGNRAKIIDMGRDLISKGISDEKIYTIMLQRSIEARLTAAADTLLKDAISKFPDKKSQFEELVKTAAAGSR